MKKLIVIYALAATSIAAHELKKYYVDFDASMQTGSREYGKKYSKQPNRSRLNRLKRLYQKNNFLRVQPSRKLKVERIIHQIWVGDAPIPKNFYKLRRTWMKLHPGWKFKFWTNKEVEKLNLVNRAYYDQTTEPAEKANILRYELLHKYGGVYIDVDFQGIRSIEPLNYLYDFYTGIEPNDSQHTLNNALIGCAKGHKIMEHVIKTIKDDWHHSKRFERSGVGHFSRCFFEVVNKVPGATVALPMSYFYPLKMNYGKKNPVPCLKPESFAVHYWANRYGESTPKVTYAK